MPKDKNPNTWKNVVSTEELTINLPYHTPRKKKIIAGRINQSPCTKSRAVLATAKLENTFWEDAVGDAVFK